MRAAAVVVVVCGSCLPAEQGAERVAGSVVIPRHVVCDFQVRCGFIGASEREACVGAPDYGSLPFLDGLPLDRETAGYSTSEADAAGRLGYDAEHVATCHAALEIGTCGSSELLACVLMKVGQVEPGDNCFDHRECTTRVCVSAGGFRGDPGCAGTCVVPATRGDACGTGIICAEGDYCDRHTSTCQPLGVEGEGCHPGLPLGGTCAAGLFCSPEGRCVAPRAEGATCDPAILLNGGCEGGLRCFEGVCAPLGREGERCGQPSVNRGGLGGLGSLGGLSGSLNRRCEEGLFCDGDDEQARCRPQRAAGDACRARDQCASDLVCVGLRLSLEDWSVEVEGRCEGWKDAGDHCDPATGANGCPASMRCDEALAECVHKDRPGVALGDRCDSSLDAPVSARCLEGSCDPETSRCALMCAQPLTFGAAMGARPQR